MITKAAEYTIADWANDERKHYDDTYFDNKARLLAGGAGSTAGTMAAALLAHKYRKHLGDSEIKALYNSLLPAGMGGTAGSMLARYGYNKAMDIDVGEEKRRRFHRKDAQ